MKKLLFSALACVAFAFSGFASNEVVEGKDFVSDLNLETQVDDYNLKVEDFAPCGISFFVFSADGEYITHIQDESDQKTASDCYSRAAGMMRIFEILYRGSSIEAVEIGYNYK